jgi:hypothetical protein
MNTQQNANWDFPPWEDRGAFDFQTFKAELTRSNANELLRKVPCPKCGTVGKYSLFDKPTSNAVGIECAACRARHPFMGWGIQWVPIAKTEKRRSNDIVAVTAEHGRYCHGCGLTPEELEKIGFTLQVHHAQPYAGHGDTGKKIPLCSLCHDLISAAQRAHRQQLKHLGRNA